MASSPKSYALHDSLYGGIRFDQPFAALIEAPVTQRMRHVRLSNIDSLDMPGIANLSRYEHVLGVAHLAGLVGFRSKLTSFEALALDGAALLHDWAITSFGHLVEEAFQFSGASFHHEAHLASLSAGEQDSDVLGLDRQILAGRELGLRSWAERSTSSPREADRLVQTISDYIEGKGRLGKIIAGTIDLDNIDNVTRMAYHLGIVRSGELATQLAKSIVDVDPDTGAPVFSDGASEAIAAWLETRRLVYNFLMLSKRDFAGKVMLLFATVSAYDAGEIKPADWSWTDGEFYSALRKSEVAATRDAADRWYTGELWEMAPLSWFSGSRPSYVDMKRFSTELTDHLQRPFFAYGIKDKRDRRLTLNISGRGPVAFGTDSDQWLLGFGSPTRQPIPRREVEKGWAFAETFFASRRLSHAHFDASGGEAAWLI